MLKLPSEKPECEALCRAMISVANEHPQIMAWLKKEKDRMNDLNVREESEGKFRRRQGGLSATMALISIIENSKNEIVRLQNGAT